MIKLTDKFILESYCQSNVANHLIREKKLAREVQYSPNSQIVANLRQLHDNIVVPAFNYLNGDIYITSGYRCEQVNQYIGGTKTSQHLKGQAIDIVYFENGKMDNKKLFEYLRNLEFDQLIWEKGGQWVHISFNAKKNRKQVLNL